MRYTQPLTLEQRQFAEDNHDLIIRFLRFKHLSQDYYDIIAFGYLRAVRKYFERPELRQYKFKTIADRAMQSNLINHYRKQDRRKRYAYTVSLDAPLPDGESLTDTIPVADTTADIVVYNSVIEKMTEILSQEQFSVLRMKAEGYSNREIAKEYGVPVYSVQEMLESIKDLVYSSIISERSSSYV